MMKNNRMARGLARRVGVIAGGGVVALSLWVGLGGSMRAAPLVPEPITCLPTCAIDGRSLVVAGDDNTTLASQEITIGLNFALTSGEANYNFEFFDGDRSAANWDVPFNDGTPAVDPNAPELIFELWADPQGNGGLGAGGLLIATWTPGAAIAGIEKGPFPTTNNGWAGVSFPHDLNAVTATSHQYALRIKPNNPLVDKGWNAFKVRAAGTVLLLGENVFGFIGAMNNPGDLTTIYPHWNDLPVGTNLTDSPYDGTWSFKTRLPAFLAEVTVYDGDMDFGNSTCAYNDTDDPDSTGIPPHAIGSAAVNEGVAQATGTFAACSAPGVGIRTGLPSEDNSALAFQRIPSIVPAGIAYQFVAPDGQIFVNANPSGNKEWEQFRIQLVDPGDAPLGACPAGGYPDDIPNGYTASDCRTTSLPGGVWEVQLDGMDLSNLNFWFFSFKVEPIVTEYSIGRLVWYDANSNGVQDLCAGVPCAPELGIANVAYTVYNGPLPGGTVVRTGVTDAIGEFLETLLPAANYTVVVDASNFAVAAPLNGLSSTTGGETENGVEVGLPVCVDTNDPVGCGQPIYAEAIFGYVRAPSVGVNAPTNTTCQDYASGTIAQENEMRYTPSGGIIGNMQPGVIFFYTKLTVGAGQTLSVAQSRTGTGAGHILLHFNQGKVYTLGCSTVLGSATQNTTTGLVTFGALQPGTYIVQLKWSPKSLVGKPVPNPATSFYTFVAQLNGAPVAGTENNPALALIVK